MREGLAVNFHVSIYSFDTHGIRLDGNLQQLSTLSMLPPASTADCAVFLERTVRDYAGYSHKANSNATYLSIDQTQSPVDIKGDPASFSWPLAGQLTCGITVRACCARQTPCHPGETLITALRSGCTFISPHQAAWMDC